MRIHTARYEKDNDFIVQMEYQTLRSKFYKLLEERGYHMTFHDLRHLSAIVMLMLNIPDKYAMERGGWLTNSILKICVSAHVLRGTKAGRLEDRRLLQQPA